MNWLNRFGKSIVGPVLMTSVSAFVLIGCSSGSDDEVPVPPDPPFDEQPTALNGSAVKGPIQNGSVTVYTLDPGSIDFKEESIATGTTDENAAINNVFIPLDTIRLTDNFDNSIYLIEVTGGTSLTSEAAPVIGTQQVIIRGSEILSGNAIFATPMTTLAYQIALLNYQQIMADDPTKGFGLALFEAMQDALDDVKTAFGFGLLGSDTGDLRYLSPIATTETALNYRTAIEATAAIVDQINSEVIADGIDSNGFTVISQLADDLTDGVIDGQGSLGRIIGLSGLQDSGELRTLITQDPSTLMIPGTSRLITSLNEIIEAEFSTVNPGGTPTSLVPIAEISPALGGTQDSDEDGYLDAFDLFPNNSREFADSDGDCESSLGYNESDYLTGTAGSAPDSCGDNSDTYPDNAAWQKYCDNPANDPECTDTDGDGVFDIDDLFPNNIAEAYDSDGDCESTLGYEENDYLTSTAGNDCGDNFDYNVCYDVLYERSVRITNEDGDIGLFGGTILNALDGGPTRGGDTFALLPYYFSTTAEMDVVDSVVNVDPFRVTLTVFTIAVSGEEPSNSNTWAAYSAVDVNYTINISDPLNITGTALNENCEDLNDIFTPFFNAGCGNLLDDPGGPLEPPPPVAGGEEPAWTNFNTEMEVINGVLDFDINTLQNKAADTRDTVNLQFRGTRIPSSESCSN